MVCSAGIMFALLGQSKMPQFGIFLAALALFHFLEYIATALFNPHKLSLDCKLLLVLSVVMDTNSQKK
jgi:protein-S-isoprenylcysteine O-methyltransferase